MRHHSTSQNFFLIGLMLFVPVALGLIAVDAPGWMIGFAVLAGVLFIAEAGKAR